MKMRQLLSIVSYQLVFSQRPFFGLLVSTVVSMPAGNAEHARDSTAIGNECRPPARVEDLASCLVLV